MQHVEWRMKGTSGSLRGLRFGVCAEGKKSLVSKEDIKHLRNHPTPQGPYWWLCMFLPINYDSHTCCQLFSKTDVFRLILYLWGRTFSALWKSSYRKLSHLIHYSEQFDAFSFLKSCSAAASSIFQTFLCVAIFQFYRQPVLGLHEKSFDWWALIVRNVKERKTNLRCRCNLEQQLNSDIKGRLLKNALYQSKNLTGK